MRGLNGSSAFGDGLGQLFVRFGMLNAPSAQEGDQIFGVLLVVVQRHDSSDGPSGLDQKGCLTSRVDLLDQVGQTTSGIINSEYGFAHYRSLRQGHRSVQAVKTDGVSAGIAASTRGTHGNGDILNCSWRRRDRRTAHIYFSEGPLGRRGPHHVESHHTLSRYRWRSQTAVRSVCRFLA